MCMKTPDLKILKSYNKIGMWISGGADSALLLYLCVNYILDNNLHTKIIPIHGWDKRREYSYSPKVAKNIIEKINELIPNDIIQPLQLCAYHKLKGEEKSKYHKPFTELLRREDIIDHKITGSTLQPNILPDIGRSSRRSTSEYSPLGDLTKRDVAILYGEYNLLESLYPLTVSCIDDLPSGPCKECWWCKEKFWAFGSYDGGVQ